MRLAGMSILPSAIWSRGATSITGMIRTHLPMIRVNIPQPLVRTVSCWRAHGGCGQMMGSSCHCDYRLRGAIHKPGNMISNIMRKTRIGTAMLIRVCFCADGMGLTNGTFVRLATITGKSNIGRSRSMQTHRNQKRQFSWW